MVVSDANLKASHPQKYYLKLMCRLIYYMGMGDCWYEKTERSRTHKIVYAFFAVIINSYIIMNVLNELFANFRTDLTFKEKNDLVQYSLAHPSLTAKYIFLILQRKQVRALFRGLVEENKYTFRCLKVEKKSVKDSLWYFVVLSFITYGTLAFATVDAFAVSRKAGTPVRIEVTLYPSRSATGTFPSVAVVLIEVHWWVLVTNMILVDALSFTSMIYLRDKFTLAYMYFDNLSVKTLNNIKAKTKTEKEIADEYEEDFITGIRIHEEALWCSRNVQSSLGNIYGVQIVESITLLVICLIKLVNLEINMTFILANGFFIACLLILNGAYMMAGGFVTYEASVLPTSMFHSGWELVKIRKQFRALAVVAIESSQRPVYMTAFGVITLSHANFISVLRSSYSFFAVMY